MQKPINTREAKGINTQFFARCKDCKQIVSSDPHWCPGFVMLSGRSMKTIKRVKPIMSTNMSSKNKEDVKWEEEFNESFCHLFGHGEDPDFLVLKPFIRRTRLVDFISKAISQARQEERDRIKKEVEKLIKPAIGFHLPGFPGEAAIQLDKFLKRILSEAIKIIEDK